MRLPRMTTRRWLIVVALVGLLLGAVIRVNGLYRWRADFNARARHHVYMQQYYWSHAHGQIAFWKESGRPDARSRLKELQDRLSQLTAYHESMSQKYQRAARYPWLPVEDDPPEP